MTDAQLVFLAALGGALIGAVGPIIAVIVQTRASRRTDLARMAVEAAMQEHSTAHEILKTRKAKIPPLSSFIFYHSRVIGLIDEGKFDRSSLEALGQEYKAIRDYYEIPKG